MTLVPLTAACMAIVAAHYHLPVNLLEGLLATEDGRVGQVVANRDKAGHVTSVDIGPFQINDQAWLGRLTAAWRQPSPQATFALLRDNGCANALAGAAIFRGYLYEAKGNFGLAVGWYNSHRPAQAAAYRRRFLASFRRVRGQTMAAR